MAEYTRDIQQLQRQASQTPQFAPPSNSLGGDIVNAVNTGLQFYERQQARTELGEAQALQAKQQEELSKGVLGLRELRQNLVNQGVSRTKLLEMENQFLSKYDAPTRMSIIKGTKEVTGETLSSFSDEITSAEEKKLKDRQTLEEEVASMAGYLTDPIDLSMSDEELRRVKLQATANQAQREKLKADVALRASLRTEQEAADEIVKGSYVIEFGNTAGNLLLQGLKTTVGQADFNNPEQVNSLITLVGEQKRQFVEQAVIQANEKGIQLSYREAEEQFAPQLEAFDLAAKELRREDIASVSKNQYNAKVDSMYFQLSQGTPKEQQLAELMLFGETFKESPYLANQITQLYGDTLLRGTVGATTDNPDSKESVLGYVKNVFSDKQEISERSKEVVFDMLMQDLDGPANKRDALFNTSFTTYAESLASENAVSKIPTDKIEQAGEVFMARSEDFLRRAIPKMLTTKSAVTFERQGRGQEQRRGPAVQSGNVVLKLNPDLTIGTEGGVRSALSDTVKKYNKWVVNMPKALENLGYSQDEINKFRESLAQSFQEVDTGEG
jgi:hypothetical protein